MPGDTLGSKQYFKINASDSYYKKGNTYIIEILFSIQNFDFWCLKDNTVDKALI